MGWRGGGRQRDKHGIPSARIERATLSTEPGATFSPYLMANTSPLDALRGDAEHIFELVFEAGTARQRGDMLRAPLECAALRGDKIWSRSFVHAGADMGSSVHAAVESGRQEIVEYLLGHGGSVHGRNASGDRPLHTAEYCSPVIVAQCACSLNALGKEEATPLFLAAQCGHLGVVETLLAADADATLRRWEERPLEIAAEHGHTDIMVALIDSGSDVNSFGPVFGTTAL